MSWSARVFSLALFSLSAPALAQSPEVPQPSPKAKVEQRVGVTDVSLEYSSPGVKARKIWGALVPYDKAWRSGANQPTRLKVSTEFSFGGKPVPAGTYALYTVPGAKEWAVVLSSSTEGWGPTGLDPKHDVVRVTVKPEAAPLRERLAYAFVNTTDESTRLDLEWEKVRVSVPITVDTKRLVLANVDKAVDDAWRPHFVSARYLLDSGGDLDRALSLIDASIAIKGTWWNQWVKAQVLGKKGRSADAVAAAEKAASLGQGDAIYEAAFKAEVDKAVADWKKKS